MNEYELVIYCYNYRYMGKQKDKKKRHMKKNKYTGITSATI